MATKAKAAKGTAIKRGDGGGSEVFTTIGEVISFSGPGESVETIDATSFDSTGAEFISSALVEAGELTLEVNFVGSDAQQQGLRADLRAGTLRNFQVILNDHTSNKTTIAISAIVTNFDGPSAASPRDKYVANITIKPSGLPTITYAPA